MARDIDQAQTAQDDLMSFEDPSYDQPGEKEQEQEEKRPGSIEQMLIAITEIKQDQNLILQKFSELEKVGEMAKRIENAAEILKDSATAAHTDSLAQTAAIDGEIKKIVDDLAAQTEDRIAQITADYLKYIDMIQKQADDLKHKTLKLRMATKFWETGKPALIWVIVIGLVSLMVQYFIIK